MSQCYTIIEKKVKLLKTGWAYEFNSGSFSLPLLILWQRQTQSQKNLR